MTPETKALCGDIAFASCGGAIGWAVGLGIISKMGLTISPRYDFSILGGFAFAALVLWLCSLSWDEDQPEAAPDAAIQTKTPE